MKLTAKEKSFCVEDNMRNKAGEVKYRCKCGEITEFYKLLGTRGKCPRCGVFC